jgi:hypothetical protein
VVPEPATGPSGPLTSVSFGGSDTGSGGGPDGLPAPTQMGACGNQSTSGTDGHLGFVLDQAPPVVKYGWIHVTLNDNGDSGLIHDWAISDSQIQVGQIPEPGALVLLAFGCMVLRRRRD